MRTVFTIRPAVAADSDVLFQWRNDPDTRTASLSQELVDRATHDVWFSRSLASATRWIFLAYDADSGDPVGMCRFDLDEDDASVEVSINLNPQWRGRGLASALLEGGIAAFLQSEPGRGPLTAVIRLANLPSARIFEAQGFVPGEADEKVRHYRRDVTEL